MEIKKKRRFFSKKLLIVSIVIILLLVAAYFIFFQEKTQTSSRGGSNSGGETRQVQVVPLSEEEREKVAGTIINSEFIKDVPEDDPISIRFYDYKEGERVWRDGFLIGENQLLGSGTPSVYLTLHSKYISEINQGNLCEVIQKAAANGDLGFHSDYGETKLLWKYKGMLKHRGCFGF